MIRQASAWVLALLLGVATAFAQQGTTEVRGRVLDPQGAMLPGVTVTVRNQDTGMFRETVSSPDGTFIVSGIVPGRYELSAELQGFKKFLRRDVELEIGKTTSLDRAARSRVAVSEDVNVTAESPMLDVTSKEVGGNITTRELVELPTINGNFVGFVGLLPGIVPTHQHRIVRQRLDRGERPGSAQQQLHAGRRQQQRRRHRPAGGHPGADRDRSDPGIPGHHQPVRRASSAGPPARSSTRSPSSGTNIWHGSAFENFSGRRPDGQGLFRQEERIGQAGHPVSAHAAARSAARSSRTRRISSSASSASSSTKG